MINRNLLRIKVIQVLYSYYKNKQADNDFDMAKDELLMSIDKTYELYHFFFQLVINITEYAEKRTTRRGIPSEEYALAKKIASNKFAAQLKTNSDLRTYVEEHDVQWPSQDGSAVKDLYAKIIESEILSEYAKETEPTYQKDKELWKNIFRRIISESEILGKELEDISIYWNDDAETVVSFVIKTIKLFVEEEGENQKLLPKFKDAEDEKFALTLFKNAIFNASDYKQMIANHTKNWDADRIAFLDKLIMQTALAEICTFPSIPVSVSINEYLELAKSYSTTKSSHFINGVLDAIVKDLLENKKVTKVAYVNNYNK